jgi:hypothetical protein
MADMGDKSGVDLIPPHGGYRDLKSEREAKLGSLSNLSRIARRLQFAGQREYEVRQDEPTDRR